MFVHALDYRDALLTIVYILNVGADFLPSVRTLQLCAKSQMTYFVNFSGEKK